ncbi:MAG: PilN domain-containing protein [Gallionella sp.]|nr:PilN domain-containing protein [Gallionella sp.]
MSEMDLIPVDYRQNVRVRRFIVKFFVLYIVLLVCIGSARILLGYLIWRENVQVVRLEQQKQLFEQNKARGDEYRLQKQEVEQQLAALDELRGGDRVTLFLHAVDNAYRAGVWLDSLHFMRRTGTGTLQAPGAANSGIIVLPNGTDATHINQGIEMVGHAINHSMLAEFMRDLDAQPGVAELILIDTSTRNYTTMQVVDFKLALKMGEKAKRQP